MANSWKWKLCSALSLLFICISPVHTADKTITWRVIDWAPFYILEGQYKGSGIYDGLIAYISERMPEYEHVTLEMTTARAKQQFRSGQNICHPSVITSPKTDPVLLSNLNSILLPHGVAYNKLRFTPSLTEPFLIEELLSDKSLSGGITPLRYSKWLNDKIEPYQSSPHLQIQLKYINLVKMLFAGRVDYILEYPPIINYWKTNKKNDLNISQVTIDDSDGPKEILVAVGCTNNSWGKTIIEKINKILSEEVKSPDFWHSRLRWYEGKNKVALRALYMKYYFEDKTVDALNSDTAPN